MLKTGKYLKYTTIEGDTFDSIALDFYDSEFRANFLMEENPDHIKTLVFEAGIELKIPQLQVEAATTLPPWKRST